MYPPALTKSAHAATSQAPLRVDSAPFDPAVMLLIRMSIKKAKSAGIKVGLCGQAPSDYPEYARFLVECGIDSISFNPDALLSGINNINEAEKKVQAVEMNSI